MEQEQIFFQDGGREEWQNKAFRRSRDALFSAVSQQMSQVVAHLASFYRSGGLFVVIFPPQFDVVCTPVLC